MTMPDVFQTKIKLNGKKPGIDPARKEQVLALADRRRKHVVGDDVTFVANMNLNLTTACTVGCLFCNFKDSAHLFEKGAKTAHDGFTRTLEEKHRGLLEKNPVNYKPPHCYDKDPGTYADQLKAMKVRGVHLHSMTPEE